MSGLERLMILLFGSQAAILVVTLVAAITRLIKKRMCKKG